MAAFSAEDHLGSIRDLRMGAGQVLASYAYDPYGAPTRSDETGGVTADYRGDGRADARVLRGRAVAARSGQV